MAQIQSIQALAESHAQEVSRSPRDWMGYLDTAARLYRYSFQENLLIHAPAPRCNRLCGVGTVEQQDEPLGQPRR